MSGGGSGGGSVGGSGGGSGGGSVGGSGGGSAGGFGSNMWGGVSHFGFDPLHARAPLSIDQIQRNRKFSKEDWGPGYFAERVLAEFHEKSPGWRADPILVGTEQVVDENGSARVLKPFNDESGDELTLALFEEITTLTEKTGERRIREVEIYDQLGSFLDHFSNMLKITPRHYNTHRLMAAAARVGQTVAMYFKNEYDFPRPNQVYPNLVPMIPVPMHPSWPSGHATEAYLVAEALGAAKAEFRTPAMVVARRIAENREVAGVHYHEDSEAGRLMAERIIALLAQGLGSTPLIEDLISRSGAELTETMG
ncbi:MAG: phosphatase PAP2 family protein [Pseudomonadota bacterium]